MSESTVPVFVVGSGRCGTHALYNVLRSVDGVEAHHQYATVETARLGAKWYHGWHSSRLRDKLWQVYGPAVHYSRARLWVDVSNKAAWLVPLLVELFPSARFVHLVRDGRKVVSSYYHKLPEVAYPDRVQFQVLDYWRRYPAVPELPPEERYWWPVPRLPSFAQYEGWSRFERLCWHWAEANEFALDELNERPRLLIHLEKLVKQPAQLRDLFNFLRLDCPDGLHAKLRRPDNVITPVDYPLTDDQVKTFWAMCGQTMGRLGYGSNSPEYRVDYHPEETGHD